MNLSILMGVILIIGIYKIENLLEQKVYIGQSVNVERRLKEHGYGQGKRIPLDIAILDQGKENFTFELIEECSVTELNDRETYWILFYKKTNKMYNCNNGGEQNSIGENNGRAKLSSQDIVDIRTAYQNRKHRKDVYEKYKDKITFNSFANIWSGRTWSHIMPEVYTEESKLYYSKQATVGELSSFAIFSDSEVIKLRQRYVKETAKEIWKDYKDKIAYNSMQKLLCGSSYQHLPIYKKKTKEWINS